MIDRIVGKKVIGIKQCKRAILNGEGIVLYIAKDAEVRLLENLIDIANSNDIKIVEIDTMNILGKMCGIDVYSAAALLLDK